MNRQVFHHGTVFWLYLAMQIVAIDDDPLMRHTLKMVLEEPFGDITTLEHPRDLEDNLSQYPIEVVILDLNFTLGSSDGNEGLAWIARIHEQYEHIAIIVLTAHGFVDVAVRSLKMGATDFLEKPFSNEKLVATVQSALNLTRSKQQLQQVTGQNEWLSQQLYGGVSYVIGESEIMRKLHDDALKVADSEASILILGESGTGKELLAQFIHQHSQRVTAPFIRVDLGTIPESLFASTLFGHQKGAYTDASEDKAGLIEMANLGTLLLEEIGEMPLTHQSKLLTVLQNRQVTRIGEHLPRVVDLRLISTSHHNLDYLQSPEHFRQDLYFRINTVTLEVPPLRQHLEDLPLLCDHFLQVFNKKYDKKTVLSRSIQKKLEAHAWSGNIRELSNTIERLVIMQDESGEVLMASDQMKESDNLYDVERDKIAELIQRHKGNISRAAKELGIGRNTLYRKMKKYGL